MPAILLCDAVWHALKAVASENGSRVPRCARPQDDGHWGSGTLAAARPQDPASATAEDGSRVLAALGPRMTGVEVRLGSVVPPDSRLPSSWGRRRRNPGSILLCDGVWHALKAVASENGSRVPRCARPQDDGRVGSAATCCAWPQDDGRWGSGNLVALGTGMTGSELRGCCQNGALHSRLRHHSPTLVYQA